ncbi:DUF4190 domain-containing protein [Microbacterium tenebrionis]|uniref:DUF4190 domain-containing protein n=1 Tax=Microbacterium tenebrionis TaxID=2830665 RepID=UPI00158F3A1A|nr:DUF4190 domain-containing protein [Microbacterium ihumii]
MSDERMNSDPEKYGTPDYPDPIAPVAYPGVTGPANMAGAPGSMHEQYPGYTGPSPYPPAPITASNGPGGMAIAALIVGIAAFVLGWVPFAGLILGVGGVVLGILALRGQRGKGFGVAGLVLSGLVVLIGLMMLFLIFMWLPLAVS